MGRFGDACGLGKNETTMAGEIRSKFSNAGAEAYAVVAKRIASTLSRKSTRKAAGPYGEKKLCLDCKAAHSKAAACTHQKCPGWLMETYRGDQSNKSNF